MVFAVKDANQQPTSLSTAADSAGSLAILHTSASVDGAGVAAATSATRPLPVINTAGGVAIDGSGSITVGGQAQNLFGGVAPTNGYLIFNNSAGILTHCDVGTASSGGASIPIAPGEEWRTPSGYKPVGPVSIFGAVMRFCALFCLCLST